jgi:hypothetical protein
MSRKQILILILIIVFLTAGFFGFQQFKQYAETVKEEHCLTTQISSRLFDFNEFNVITEDNLDIDDFKIENLNCGNTIFKDGKSFKGIKNEYGKCMFRLYDKDSPIYDFGHRKYNNWHTNNYSLRIKKDLSNIVLKLTITGPDSLSEIYYIPHER